MNQLNKNFDKGEYPSTWNKSKLIKKCFAAIARTGEYFTAQICEERDLSLPGEIGTIVISQANTYIVDSGEWHLSSLDQSLRQDWFAIDVNLNVRHVGTTHGIKHNNVKLERMVLNNSYHYILIIDDDTKIENCRLNTEFQDNRLTPIFDKVFSVGEIMSMMPILRFN